MVPVRDEAAALPSLVRALAAQQGVAGASWEVLLLLNNCTDGSRDVARALGARYPGVPLHVATVELAAGEAHVGTARRIAMDAAAARLVSVGAPSGVICSTDADSRPAPDWLAETVGELAAGVDAVTGRIVLDAADRAALPRSARRALLLDIGYRRALEALRDLYAPTPHDPFPRHHQHFGASFAVRADAYLRAGGLPPVRSSEDVALYHALLQSGARVRHSYRVRVTTSGRRQGRAQRGLADVLAAWSTSSAEPRVEPAADAEARIARLALAQAAGAPLAVADLHPAALAPGAGEPIGDVLRDLRQLTAAVSALSPARRLHRAARLAPFALAA